MVLTYQLDIMFTSFNCDYTPLFLFCVAELQVQLASSMEKERNSTEEMLGLTCSITTLESHVSSLRQEKAKLNAQLNVEKTRADTLQEQNNRLDRLRREKQVTASQTS